MYERGDGIRAWQDYQNDWYIWKDVYLKMTEKAETGFHIGSGLFI